MTAIGIDTPAPRPPRNTPLDQLCEKHGIRLRLVYVSRDPDKRTHYRAYLSRGRIRATVAFSAGSAWAREDIRPADVLYCVISDAQGADQSFEHWCGDYGYDTDSRRAYATWQACKQMIPRMKRLCGAELAEFQEAASEF